MCAHANKLRHYRQAEAWASLDDSHGMCSAEHSVLSDGTLLHLQGSMAWHDGIPVRVLASPVLQRRGGQGCDVEVNNANKRRAEHEK